MPWFGDDHDVSQYHNEYQGKQHKAEFTHEAMAGAAAFAAARKYEKHCEENGKPQNHAMAKELLAGFAGAFIDREVETKGLDFIDRQKAKHAAQKHCEEEITINNY